MTEEEKVLAVYKESAFEVKRWNEKFYPLMEADCPGSSGEAKAEIKVIFDIYVWDDAKRRQERENAPSVSNPSDYDPSSEAVEDFSMLGTSASICVRSKSGFQNLFRYTLTRKDDVWKLSKRDIFVSSSNKWKSHHI